MRILLSIDDAEEKSREANVYRRNLTQARWAGWVPLVALLALLGSPSAATESDGAGLYNEAQAGRGEVLYQQYCSAMEKLPRLN